MKIHLVDGTYELFRSHFGAPSRKAPDGREVGATLGLLNSLLVLLTKSGATHVACAFDHVIESFRNELFPGYKTSAGVAPELLAQFALAEQAVAALGVVVWPMVEFEADDALASATLRFSGEAGVEQVVICSRTKTSPRWFWATRWSAGIVAATSCMTKRLCWRNLGFDPPRFPIGWPWSAIPLTATRGSPAGGQSLRARCSGVTSTSSPFPKTRANGALEVPEHSGLPRVSGFIRRMCCCIAAWPRCDTTFRSKSG